MRKIIKRGICVVLASTLFLTACGIGTAKDGGAKDSADADELVAANRDDSVSTYRHGTTFEEDYIHQHLEYVNSEEYGEIRDNRGGLAGGMGKAYEAAGLDDANKSWEVFSVFLQTYSGKKVELETGYEPVVAELMNSTASQTAFVDNYETAVMNAILKLLKAFGSENTKVKKTLEQFKSPSLGKVEDVTEKIDKWIKVLSEIEEGGNIEAYEKINEMEAALDELEGKSDGLKTKSVKPLYEDALKEFKKTIGLDFSELMDEEKMKKCMEGLDVAEFVWKTATGTYEELIDQYVLRMALADMEEEWYYTWELISGFALSSETSEGKALSQTIDKMLVDLRASSESDMAAMWESMKAAGTNQILHIGGDMLIKFYDGMTNRSPHLILFKTAGKLGHKWSNDLVNMDAIALNGRMVQKTGIVAVYAEKALDVADELLKVEQTFQTARLFDQAFHVYKEVQIQACEYASEYYQAIDSAGVTKISKQAATAHAEDISALGKEKKIWEDYECHGSANLLDGTYLSVDGTLYYWEETKESFEEIFMYQFWTADFNWNAEHENTLIARSPDGTKEEIASVKGAYGKIWYVGNTIYGVRKTPDFFREIFGVKRVGSEITYYGEGEWIDYDEKTGLMVGSTRDNGVIAVDVDTGEVKTLAENTPANEHKVGELDQSDSAILLTNGYLFYSDAGNNNWKDFAIRVMDLVSGEDRELYRVVDVVDTLSKEENSFLYGNQIKDIQETEEFVFISFGLSEGVADIYHGGKILWIDKRDPFTSGESGNSKVTALYELEADSERLLEWQFMAVNEDGEERLYFNYYDDDKSTFAWLSDDTYVEYPYKELYTVGEVFEKATADGLEYGWFESGLHDYKSVLTWKECETLSADAGYADFANMELTLRQLEVVDGHLYGILQVWIPAENNNSTRLSAGAKLEESLMFDKDLETGEIVIMER